MWPYLLIISGLVSVSCAAVDTIARKKARRRAESIYYHVEGAKSRETDRLYYGFKNRMEPDVREWFEREIR